MAVFIMNQIKPNAYISSKARIKGIDEICKRCPRIKESGKFCVIEGCSYLNLSYSYVIARAARKQEDK